MLSLTLPLPMFPLCAFTDDPLAPCSMLPVTPLCVHSFPSSTLSQLGSGYYNTYSLLVTQSESLIRDSEEPVHHIGGVTVSA